MGDKIQKERRQLFEKEKAKHIKNGTNESLINLTQMLEEEEKHDIETKERFEHFITKHNGQSSKQLLILDIDNTLIYVRFFSEECQIGDVCTYFHDGSPSKGNAKIIKLRLTLSLEITN